MEILDHRSPLRWPEGRPTGEAVTTEPAWPGAAGTPPSQAFATARDSPEQGPEHGTRPQGAVRNGVCGTTAAVAGEDEAQGSEPPTALCIQPLCWAALLCAHGAGGTARGRGRVAVPEAPQSTPSPAAGRRPGGAAALGPMLQMPSQLGHCWAQVPSGLLQPSEQNPCHLRSPQGPCHPLG